ncbi:MAG: hypothetical protein R3E32_03995 [Chitinophagales bacterium]
MKLCILHDLQDDFYLQQLLKHLHPLQQLDLIEVWHTQQILAGRKMEEVLLQELKAADVVMPLLSADFLAGETYLKMTQTLSTKHSQKKELSILPVLLRHCQWDMTFLKTIKILPSAKYPLNDDFWKSSDHAFDVIVEELKRLLQSEEPMGEEQAAKEGMASPKRKMAWVIKNLQVRSEPNERGQFVPIVVSKKVEEKLAEYVEATEKMEVLEVEGIRFTRAELLTKKAVLDFTEAYVKGWKKYIELQNRSFFSLTKGLENLGNTGLMLYKRRQTNMMLKEARRLEPQNVEVLLASMRFLMLTQTKDVKGKSAYLSQIEQILTPPQSDTQRFQLAIARMYQALEPTGLNRSLLQKVRADFEAIGKLNYVAYCDGLLIGGEYVGG